MNFFYSVMGFIAQKSDTLSRQRINLIPYNWLIMVTVPLLSFAFIFSEKDPFRRLWMGPLAFAACFFAALLFLSWCLRNVIFQKQSGVSAPSTAIGSAPVVPFESVLLFTGKLRLQEKVARRFLAMPARLVTLENGARAFASSIDASSRTFGVVTTARKGIWLSIPRPGTVQVENGIFYYGFAGKPALRMSYVDELDGTKNNVVVAFETVAQREAARAALNLPGSEQASLNPAFS